MRKNIIIYETNYGTAKKVAEVFSLILGFSKIVDIKDVSNDISKYDNVILIFGFHGYDTAEKIKEYLRKNSKSFFNKRIAIIGVGLSKQDLNRYSNDLCIEMGRKADIIKFVQGEIRVDKLNKNDKEILEKFLNKQGMKLMDMGKFKVKDACNIASICSELINKPTIELNKEELIGEINKFIIEHNTCVLSTGVGDYVRSTPIEYNYIDGEFYFITEGGFKFVGLIQNKNVSISIFNNYKGMGNLKGLQIKGKAEVVNNNTDDYKKVIKVKGINLNHIKNIGIQLNIIKVKVIKFEMLNSDFHKKGADVKQIVYL